MSTRFGVKIPTEDQFYTELGYRYGTGRGTVTFSVDKKNSILFWTLPKDTPVIPLDNTAQGVVTIDDLRRMIQRKKRKQMRHAAIKKQRRGLL